MLTAEQICNLALSYVGNREPIDSLNEPTLEAQQCSIHYPAARDVLLSGHWWPFATRHQTLALLPTPRSGWAFAYALPTDLLKPRYIFSGARPGALAIPVFSSISFPFGALPMVSALPMINGAVPQVAFELELSDDGNKQILVTDQENAELVYTFKLQDRESVV